VPHSTDEAGEFASRGPGGGKGAPCRGTAGRKQGRYAETGTRVHETTADSGAGAAVAAEGVHLPQPLPGPPLAARGLQPHLRGRCPRAWTDRPARTTGPTCWATCSRSWGAPSPARTERPPCGACTSPRDRAQPRRGPLGVPTFEDKVLQRAVVMALEPIY